ncbi:MAG: hypothetical protein IPO83_14540 [Chitinophagaceae bacterium]|nr:hypothetical protein [Chitinophagaceae bacterium]
MDKKSLSTLIAQLAVYSGKKTWYRAVATGSGATGAPSDPAWVMVP